MASDNLEIRRSLADGEAAAKGASLFITAANSAKTVLGAGILSLSWAFYFSTMYLGVFFTIAMAFLSAYGFYLLGLCSEMTGMKAYGDIWKHTYGEDKTWVPNLATFTFCFLAIIAYLIICGDYLPLAAEGLNIHVGALNNSNVMILIIWLLLLPLCFLRDLSFLGYTSIIGTIGSLYTCFILFFEMVEFKDKPGNWEPLECGPGLFLMVPTVAFAYNGHFNAPDLYQSLDQKSPRRWLLVTIGAFGLCAGITLVCGVSGYFMFGSELNLPGRSNVLKAPEFKGKAEIMCAYIATTFSVALGIPLYAQGGRDSLDMILLRFFPSLDQCNSTMRRNILMCLLLGTTMTIAQLIDDLGLINSIGGALCASLIMYVFPPLMYIKCCKSAGVDMSMGQRILAKVSIVTGLLLAIAGIVTAVLHASQVNIPVR